jgi:heme/copper-type cytochrome/quinol oxidase subunit 2
MLKNCFYVISALVITLVTSFIAAGSMLLADELDKYQHEGTTVYMAALMAVVVCPVVMTMAGVLWSIRLMEKSDL